MHAWMLISIYANCNKASLGPTYQKCSEFQVNLHIKWSETIVLISPIFAEWYKIQSFTYITTLLQSLFLFS
jgi:hypothetical protein